MLEVDGSTGGGQLVRTALALAALTGEPVRMEGIRGARDTPGLRPQHLAAVRTLASVCDAEVTGDAVGSETLEFAPGDLRGGRYSADIGTAGSVTLLFDALLPLATALEAPVAVTATGGTDVKWSPTTAYYRRVKLPALRAVGLQAAVELDRTGFYPAGGGRATLYLAPSTLSPLSLTDRGAAGGVRIHSKAAASLADPEVAERQAEAADEALDPSLDRREVTTSYVETETPGSAVLLRLDFEGGYAGFDALGERGKPAEDVAREAAEAAADFLAGSAAVDRHLADQLVVFLALAGGRVRVPAVTDHVETCLDLLDAFELPVSVEEADDGAVLAGR